MNGAAFFTDVDLLAGSDETDDDAPPRNSLGELDEMLRLRQAVAMLWVLLSDHRRVERSLGLIEDENVLRRDELTAAAVCRDVFLHTADERLSATARTLQLVLEDFHERAVAREKHGRSGRLAILAIHDKVVEPPGMGDL